MRRPVGLGWEEVAEVRRLKVRGEVAVKWMMCGMKCGMKVVRL